MTGFWVGAGALILLATGFVLVPLWRGWKRDGRAFASGPLIALTVVPVSIGLYFAVSSYDPDLPQTVASSDEIALLERLSRITRSKYSLPRRAISQQVCQPDTSPRRMRSHDN